MSTTPTSDEPERDVPPVSAVPPAAALEATSSSAALVSATAAVAATFALSAAADSDRAATVLERPRDPGSITDASALRRIEESGSSVEEARTLARRLYGGARFRPLVSEQGFAYRFASLGDGDLSLRLLTTTTTVVVDIEKLDDYVATWFRDGSSAIATTRFETDVPPGQPAILPSTTPFTLTMQPGRQNLVHVSRAFLDRVATERHGGAVQPLVLCADRLPDPESNRRWREAISAATPVVTDPDSTPLMRMESNLLVARTLLSVFTWHTHDIPPALLTPRLTRVRGAIEFLHENAHLPIAPADAAAHVGIHTRSLQNAFQRHLGLSPTEYLRNVRLDRVRRDLIEHTPETAMVSDLARAWGFGNQGRFATSYRARFGEKPNETLRR